MDKKRRNGEGEHPDPIDALGRHDLEDGVHARGEDHEELEGKAKDEGNPEQEVLVLEDADEALLEVHHAEHMEELGEGEDAEGHRLRGLKGRLVGGEVIDDRLDGNRLTSKSLNWVDEEGDEGR